MLPSNLATICAIVGVALLSLALGTVRYYREKVDRSVFDRISEILLRKEIDEFVMKIRKRELTFRVVSDFYERFYEANYPARLLKSVFWEILLSGILFIMAAITGSIDFASFETIAYGTLVLGCAMLAISLIGVYRLESIV